MTWDDQVDQVIAVLNRIHKTDPTVLQQLIFHRVPCNEALADDPTVQVGMIEGKPHEWEVGLLGIINGIFGVDEHNQKGFIAVNVDKDGQITGFRRLSR